MAPTKKAKRMDQEYISKEEFNKDRALKRQVVATLRDCRANIMADIEGWSSVQTVRRIFRSARRQKLGALGLLEKFCGLG